MMLSRQELEKLAFQNLHKLSSTQLQEIVDRPPTVVTSHPPIWSWQGDCLLHWDTDQHEYVVFSTPFIDQDVDLENCIYITHFNTFIVFYFDETNLVMTMFDLEGLKLWDHKIANPQEKIIIPEYPQVGKYCLIFSQNELLVFLPRIDGVDLVFTQGLKSDQVLIQIYAISNCHFVTLHKKNFARVWEIVEQDSKIRLLASKKRSPLSGTIYARHNYIVQEHDNKFIKHFVDENTGKYNTQQLLYLPFDEPSYSISRSGSLSYEGKHCLCLSDEQKFTPINSELFVITHRDVSTELYCRGQLLYSDDRLWAPVSRQASQKEILYWAKIFQEQVSNIFPSCLWMTVANYI